MYTDIQYKLRYHKEKIINSFIRRGIFPSNKLIQSKLNDIELRLAIFTNPNIGEGSSFNTKEFNESINSIYNDLSILYKLLNEVTVNEYNRLSYYINSHLRELNDVANMYLKRAELESNTTALGHSILFKHNNFDMEIKDDLTVISLGDIAIEDASKIACISNFNNTDFENVVFKFRKDDEVISCNAYNYNHDTVIFPGEKKRNEYEILINESQKITGPLELPIVVADITSGKFITMAGKDKILYKRANENGEIIEEKPIAINALSFDEHSYIDFYVIGGSSINFRFNKKPIATNFNMNSNTISNLSYIHHFFIECEKGFSFDFELNKGSVFAIKENTLIEQERLIYSGQIDVKDFLIIHELPGKLNNYNSYVEIHNTSLLEDDVSSIMIKKIG